MAAQRVIIAVPPRVIASTIEVIPPLSKSAEVMLSTPTWAGDWCKVVASFKEAFWRKNGDSGVAQLSGHKSLLAVTWEATHEELEGANCLAGLNFGVDACEKINSFGLPDPLTGLSPPGLRDAVQKELSEVFGTDVVARHLIDVYHKSWNDTLTFGANEGPSGIRDPRVMYGHALLRAPTQSGIHFAGTETERRHGHVDGAVLSGERAANEVLATF